MVLDDLPTPNLAPDEALVEVAFAGINFYDTQLRSGLIKRDVPVMLGLEGAGTIAAAGSQARLAVGTRVAWAQSPGAYATHAVVPAARLVGLPREVTFEQAAAVLFQGVTAHHLACATYPLGPKDTCVVHSAAGGVGTLLCQIAKMRGARVIAAVSTDAKAAAVAEIADHVVIYDRDDLIETTKSLTAGRGADVVYDAVGKDTFEVSLAALRPRGFLVVYGEASGLIPPFDVRKLSAAGSVYVTRTSLGSYVATREEYLERAEAVLRWVDDGRLVPRIHRVFALAEAPHAHRALENRETIGKLLLRCA